MKSFLFTCSAVAATFISVAARAEPTDQKNLLSADYGVSCSRDDRTFDGFLNELLLRKEENKETYEVIRTFDNPWDPAPPESQVIAKNLTCESGKYGKIDKVLSSCSNGSSGLTITRIERTETDWQELNYEAIVYSEGTEPISFTFKLDQCKA